MTSLIDQISWDIDHAAGYLLCYDIPFGDPTRPGAHADHYLGIGEDVPKRVARHGQGKGAKITRYARQAGIGWTVTRVWENIDRHEERRLKENAGMAWCPRCRTERVMARREPAYGLAIAGAKAAYRETVAGGRAAREQATSRSAGTRAWNKAVATAHEQLQQVRHEAAVAWVSEHPRPGLVRSWLDCVADATPVVTPPMRARQAVLDAQAAARAQAVPDGFLADGVNRPDPDSGADPHDPWNERTARGLVVATAVPSDAWALADAEAG